MAEIIEEQNLPIPQEQQPEKKSKKNSKSKKTSQIISISFLVIGIILLLSIISYTAADEVNGEMGFDTLLKIFINDPILQDRAANTSNWLGLFGAFL